MHPAIHPTLEVRWFLEGKAATEMWRWFERGAIAPTEEGLREDWYLYSVENSSLGIKLREAKLEIKQRLRNAGIHSFTQNVQGQAETWIKWDFSLDSEFNLPQFNQSDGFWVLVRKARASKHYRIDADGDAARLTPIETPSEATQGCSLELTELQVWEQNWHSLGLETFGAVELAALPQIMQDLYTDCELTLKAADSFGYPQWLQHLG
jgi:hypothetical protein